LSFVAKFWRIIAYSSVSSFDNSAKCEESAV